MAMINKSAILIIALLIVPLAGCNKGAATSNSDSKSNSNSGASPATDSSPVAQANSNTKPAENSDAQNPAPDPAKMLGTYQMVQVQKSGVVNMLSQARSEITFSPEGTYSRLSKIKDKVIHDDQGQYRIEGADYLVLTIQVSRKNIHNPPLEKRHKISLSRDGEELKMISENGDIAVFHKIRKT